MTTNYGVVCDTFFPPLGLIHLYLAHVNVLLRYFPELVDPWSFFGLVEEEHDKRMVLYWEIFLLNPLHIKSFDGKCMSNL